MLDWRGPAFVALAARGYLAIVFRLACYHEILAPHDLAPDMATHQTPPLGLVNLMALILPWVELATGLMLLVGFRARSAALLISVRPPLDPGATRAPHQGAEDEGPDQAPCSHACTSPGNRLRSRLPREYAAGAQEGDPRLCDTRLVPRDAALAHSAPRRIDRQRSAVRRGSSIDLLALVLKARAEGPVRNSPIICREAWVA